MTLPAASVTGGVPLRNQVGCVIGRVDELPADGDECQHDRHLDEHDDGVHQRRFLRAANEQQQR